MAPLVYHNDSTALKTKVYQNLKRQFENGVRESNQEQAGAPKSKTKKRNRVRMKKVWSGAQVNLSLAYRVQVVCGMLRAVLGCVVTWVYRQIFHVWMGNK